MVMEVRPVQAWKAPEPILVTPWGIVVFLQPQISSLLDFLIIALQLSRESYFVLTPSTVIVAKLLQPEKAIHPILVTELGIVTDVMLLQSEKAPEPILVTELGIVTDTKLRQLEKALSPISVTPWGIVMEVRPLQDVKAPPPILVTLLGIVMEVRPLL